MRVISSKSSRSVVTEATEFPESRRIHDEVSAAAKRYEESRTKLTNLISSLKKQYSLTLKTSEKRLQTAKQFEAFLADTPLSKLVSEVGSAEAKEKVFAHTPRKSELPKSQPLEKIESGDAASDRSSENREADEDDAASRSSVSTTADREGESENTETDDEINDRGGENVGIHNSNDSATSENLAIEEEVKEESRDEETKPKPIETDEEMAVRLAKEWEDEAEEWKGPSAEKEDEKSVIKACATGETESSEESKDLTEPESPVENKPHASVPRNHKKDPPPQHEPFQSLVFDGSDFDEVHHSFVAVHEASHKLTVLYSDQYSSNIIKYVEEWDKAASTRIHGRLLEFDRMKLNLEHYVQKVDGLRTGIKKRERRSRRVSPKASQRFDRNELKLSGAREAYDSYGESLLLFLEEVTERAWRDCFPLLMRAMQYDINFSADQARVFSSLNETVEMLEELGAAREVDPDGRIRTLKDSKPEEIYTGGRHVVPPVHSTRDVYEV